MTGTMNESMVSFTRLRVDAIKNKPQKNKQTNKQTNSCFDAASYFAESSKVLRDHRGLVEVALLLQACNHIQ